MSSQVGLLARPDASSVNSLPVYKQDASPPAYTTSSRRLSTIVELEDEDRVDPNAAQPGCWTSIEMKKLLSVEYATMVPQALLVDASSTLCAYLYFTSLQARMALQHRASLDVLSVVCAAVSANDDPSLLDSCATAISQYQSTASADFIGISHYVAIGLVLFKAMTGFYILTHASRYVRPFDYLVASGAAHCLMLYCVFFVPVASLLDEAAAGPHIWAEIMTKFFWLLVDSATFAIVHWSARAVISSPSVQLEDSSAALDRLDEKDSSEIA